MSMKGKRNNKDITRLSTSFADSNVYSDQYYFNPGSLVHQKQKRRGENKEEGRKKGAEKFTKILGFNPCCGSESEISWFRIDLARLVPDQYWDVDPDPGA
jgi:hypothetical protein